MHSSSIIRKIESNGKFSTDSLMKIVLVLAQVNTIQSPKIGFSAGAVVVDRSGGMTESVVKEFLEQAAH